MRKIREVLRLKAEGFSDRQDRCGDRLGALDGAGVRAPSREAGLAWPLPDELDEAALQARLYRREVPLSRTPAAGLCAPARRAGAPAASRGCCCGRSTRPRSRRAGSTACSAISTGAGSPRQELVLRKNHAPRRQALRRLRRPDGADRRSAHAARCARRRSSSPCSAARTTPTPRPPGRRRCPTGSAATCGRSSSSAACPRAIVPDNLQERRQARAPLRAARSTRSYQDFAEHYGVAILPARVRKPRDKAKVEAGVLVVERWILARLRNRTFFSLGELNAAIGALLEHLNHAAVQEARGMPPLALRRARYARAAPAAGAPVRVRRVEEGEGPSRLSHRGRPRVLLGALPLDRRAGRCAPERARGGDLPSPADHRRACPRQPSAAGARRVDAHRPERHVAVIERTSSARSIGPPPSVRRPSKLLRQQAAHRKHPEETLRSAQGILRLARDFSARRARARLRSGRSRSRATATAPCAR